MCEYDYDYEPITRREVLTRKEHECGSCMRDYPAGTRMVVYVGKTEGELGRTYACPTCVFAANQKDHGPLHFCWGHFWDGNDPATGDSEVFEYIKRALAKGKVPKVSGARAARRRAIERERLEMSA